MTDENICEKYANKTAFDTQTEEGRSVFCGIIKKSDCPYDNAGTPCFHAESESGAGYTCISHGIKKLAK